MANWGDRFADSFSNSFDRAQQMSLKALEMKADSEYRKWQMKQEEEKLALEKEKMSPEYMQKQIQAQMGAYVPFMQPEQREAYLSSIVPPQAGQPTGPGIPLIPTGMTGGKVRFGQDPIALAAQKKMSDKNAELNAKLSESALTSKYNFDLTAQSMSDYSKLLANSWMEGGAGNAVKNMKTKAAMKGVPLGDASQYKSSGALPGKLVEIVSKQFPMLTQQIGKEGSVRLIESVFEKLGSSYPNASTPPELAPEQLKQSLLSMYRIVRAMGGFDATQYDLSNKKVRDDFVKNITNGAKDIELSPEEQKQFDEYSNKILEPVYAGIELMKRKKKGK